MVATGKKELVAGVQLSPADPRFSAVLVRSGFEGQRRCDEFGDARVKA